MRHQSIWKFPIGDKMENEIEMPLGALILSVQMQNNVPTLWALVDVNAKPKTRKFAIVGTGWDFDLENSKYLVTLQDINGFVWHIFEVF